MTKITYGPGSIEISGHAPQAVVCHGISAISQMVANYLESRNIANTVRKDGYLKINFDTGYIHPVLDAFYEGIKDIDAEYPGNIIFEYV